MDFLSVFSEIKLHYLASFFLSVLRLGSIKTPTLERCFYLAKFKADLSFFGANNSLSKLPLKKINWKEKPLKSEIREILKQSGGIRKFP